MRASHASFGFVIALGALFVVPQAFAHHSFAPHFDSSKPANISGTITEFEARNPHSYLHIAATDENGRTREYVCESHGVTQLSRNGIKPEMLKAGTKVKALFEDRVIIAEDGGFTDNFVGTDTYGYEGYGVEGDLTGFVKDPNRELPRMMPSGTGYKYGPTSVHIYEIGD